jgi:hypothetical protein|tara:strand:+ start:786 stop:1463 length:678 start_codon:yes stop_codon:yes gene_type:complete
MKKALSIIFLALFFTNNLTAAEFIYGTPTYWSNLNQNEKDYYAKGVLDAWGYEIYNQAPDKQKDELIAKFRHCIKKNFNNFQNYMYMLGWDGGTSSAGELMKSVQGSCNLMEENNEYKGIKIQKNKPIQNVTLSDWTQLPKNYKEIYIEGYIDMAIFSIYNAASRSDAPKDYQEYYKKLLVRIKKCFKSKNMNDLPIFTINRFDEFDKLLLLPWNVSISFGKFCK